MSAIQAIQVPEQLCVVLPWLQLEESNIIDFLENMCNTAKPDGSWVSHYDMVEEGDKLKLVDIGKVCTAFKV